jgi:hypothetical protein
VPILDLGNGVTATAINRSAREINTENKTVNIHHLVSSIDGSADTGLNKTQVAANLKAKKLQISDTNLRVLRASSAESKNRGLLGIYVVDAKSVSTTKNRHDLQLEEHAIGLGIFFGTSKVVGANITYYGPDLVDLFVVEDDIDNDDDYLDSADESDTLVIS